MIRDAAIDLRRERVCVLLEDWRRARPLEESKLWLFRRDDIIGREEGPGEGLTGDRRLGMLGTLAMLGHLSRFGMLLRNFSIFITVSKQYNSQDSKHAYSGVRCAGISNKGEYSGITEFAVNNMI